MASVEGHDPELCWIDAVDLESHGTAVTAPALHHDAAVSDAAIRGRISSTGSVMRT